MAREQLGDLREDAGGVAVEVVGHQLDVVPLGDVRLDLQPRHGGVHPLLAVRLERHARELPQPRLDVADRVADHEDELRVGVHVRAARAQRIDSGPGVLSNHPPPYFRPTHPMNSDLIPLINSTSPTESASTVPCQLSAEVAPREAPAARAPRVVAPHRLQQLVHQVEEVPSAWPSYSKCSLSRWAMVDVPDLGDPRTKTGKSCQGKLGRGLALTASVIAPGEAHRQFPFAYTFPPHGWSLPLEEH